MNVRFYLLVIGVSLLLCSPAAFADGMPFKEKAPEPILTPLDKALTEMQAGAPVDLQAAQPDVKEPDAEKPSEVPVTAELPAPPVAPPLPESRVVEVQPDTSFFGLSVGMYDPVTHSEKAASFNLEWQPGVKIVGFLQPLFGAMVTTNGAMLGYGGLGVPVQISDRVMLMPSVALGAYRKGGGYDLGRTLAFRVGTELAYQFEDKSRIGLNMHILTNGRSTDREDRTEVFGITYTVPFHVTAAPHATLQN